MQSLHHPSDCHIRSIPTRKCLLFRPTTSQSAKVARADKRRCTRISASSRVPDVESTEEKGQTNLGRRGFLAASTAATVFLQTARCSTHSQQTRILSHMRTVKVLLIRAPDKGGSHIIPLKYRSPRNSPFQKKKCLL
jgi:hypothetical protein